MARMRIVKPGFYQNEALAEMPHQTRLYFIYLWMLCDREGKMEFRPKKIKHEIFPYEDADIKAMTQCLHGAGMVHVWVGHWEGEEVEFLQVCKFNKHQHPHRDEKAKGYPDLDKSMVPAWCKHGVSTPLTGNLEQGTGNLEHEKRENEKNDEEKESRALPPKYAFQGEVIRVSWSDMEKWRKAFEHIDVLQELYSLDAFYVKQGKAGKDTTSWFWRTAQSLATANQKRMAEKTSQQAYVAGLC